MIRYICRIKFRLFLQEKNPFSLLEIQKINENSTMKVGNTRKLYLLKTKNIYFELKNKFKQNY